MGRRLVCHSQAAPILLPRSAVPCPGTTAGVRQCNLDSFPAFLRELENSPQRTCQVAAGRPAGHDAARNVLTHSLNHSIRHHLWRPIATPYSRIVGFLYLEPVVQGDMLGASVCGVVIFFPCRIFVTWRSKPFRFFWGGFGAGQDNL